MKRIKIFQNIIFVRLIIKGKALPFSFYDVSVEDIVSWLKSIGLKVIIIDDSDRTHYNKENTIIQIRQEKKQKNGSDRDIVYLKRLLVTGMTYLAVIDKIQININLQKN